MWKKFKYSIVKGKKPWNLVLCESVFFSTYIDHIMVVGNRYPVSAVMFEKPAVFSIAGQATKNITFLEHHLAGAKRQILEPSKSTIDDEKQEMTTDITSGSLTCAEFLPPTFLSFSFEGWLLRRIYCNGDVLTTPLTAI